MLPNTLRSGPPQAGHSVSDGSLNDCCTSRRSPHSLHAYSYVGTGPLPDLWLALSACECQE